MRVVIQWNLESDEKYVGIDMCVSDLVDCGKVVSKDTWAVSNNWAVVSNDREVISKNMWAVSNLSAAV